MKIEVVLTGSPSTGYMWEPSQKPDDERHVERYPPDDDDIVIGGQVLSTYIFNDIKPGAVLSFNYLRPWETDTDPAATASVRIES